MTMTILITKVKSITVIMITVTYLGGYCMHDLFTNKVLYHVWLDHLFCVNSRLKVEMNLNPSGNELNVRPPVAIMAARKQTFLLI